VTNKILLVDDDPNILAGFRRQMRKGFECETAESGPLGLAALGRLGPFAVVVSDMRMPGMDGVAFLTEVERRSPDTVRIMLTGNADLQTCIDAVNQGHIFRFLTKPCEPEQLSQAINSGLKQYQLVRAEHELIHGTVTGCVRTLTEILGVVSPAAFSRGARMRRYVRHMAAQLNATHLWEYEMAAALSQIGYVALPQDLMARVTAGRPLTNQQRAILANHPAIGCQLLSEIPRLSLVALIVQQQRTPLQKPIMPHENMTTDEIVEFGAQLLHVALNLDALVIRGETFIKALAALHEKFGPDHPIVDTLMSFEKDAADKVIVQVNANELTTSMISTEEIRDSQGNLLLSPGQRLSRPMIFHLQGCVQTNEIQDRFIMEVLSE
jgi:FixJ family two-component response regulator